MPKQSPKSEEKKINQGMELSADDVLVPDSVATIEYGPETIYLKPMSLKTALRIGKFIAQNFGRAFNSESFQRAKTDPSTTTFEMWSGIANEFLSTLDDKEIIELLCEITGKDEPFIQEHFSLLRLTRVIRAVYLTEDFEEIFLEFRKMTERESQKK